MIPIPFLLGNWKLIAVGLLAVTVGMYVWHCERAKNKLAASIALAEQQAVENAKQALRDLKNKERVDENYIRNVTRLRADVKRLRNASASLVPPAPAGSPSPERACFDRADLTAAIRSYREGVLGLLEEGGAAVEGLDEARRWAGGR